MHSSLVLPEMPSEEDSFPFHADRAKTGRSNCKKCKQKIEQGSLRMAKTGSNPFGSGVMKMWHHLNCMFEVFARQRATTVKIECVDDIGGWDNLSKEDQEEILSRLPDSVRAAGRKKKVGESSSEKPGSSNTKKENAPHKDDSVREYRRLLADVANLAGSLDKSAKIKEFFTKGSDGESFKGDLGLWIRLLLPGVIKRVYNLQAKQIVKLFSRIFRADHEEMLESLEQGDVAETIRIFFEANQRMKPSAKSTLTLQEIDKFLEHLSKLTQENDQINHFESIIPRCTGNDLKIIIRLIRHDLRINAGAKPILDAVHPDAYEAFQASRDINTIIEKISSTKGKDDKMNIGIAPMVPVLPMLAQACRSSQEAITRCPKGMYSEVKYDGERVQVHKKGNQFKYFSRSLKPVMPHKVRPLEEYIPKAFPCGEDLILDSEILMIDTVTGQPLPFGTLGIHKKGEYENANVCLFVFDCIYYNGESLLNCPIRKRRKILYEHMTEIKNRIVFSEMRELYSKKDLEDMMTEVFKQGLEGLVLKDLTGTYEPGKRHWLKVKKDYLFGGAMADSADLVVLGAWYGTGQKGGMMSIFLMGCYDEGRRRWCTVTKVHSGHDDATLERLQTELDMIKISKDANKVPSWLHCTKTMIPDFVAKDPKAQPVWEITGAELTKNVVHTADGISVRFPRVTRIRTDKDWETATSLSELKVIYQKSKETADFTLAGSSDPEVSVSPRKSSKKKPIGSPLSIKTSKVPKADSESPKKRKIMELDNEDSQQSTSTASISSSGESPKKRAKKETLELSEKSSEGKKKKSKYPIKTPLPDVFIGIKIFFDPKILPQKEREVLERYFVAYGGESLKESEKEKANRKFGAKVEDRDWLRRSIRDQKLSN